MTRFFTHRKTLLIQSLVLVMSMGDVSAQMYEMTPKEPNYKIFRDVIVQKNDELLQHNSGYEAHPELGLIYAGAPCTNCFEILEKRTETTKTFAELGTKGAHVWVQSSTAPLHFKNERDQWITIQPELAPVKGRTGLYASVSSPCPVVIDTKEGFTQMGNKGASVTINRHLELIWIAADGSERFIGNASWQNYTAGDDGIYVKDIWPGVDMEVAVYYSGTKTNFWLNRPMPEYAGGRLAIRDGILLDESLSLRTNGKQWSGPLEVLAADGSSLYTLDRAVAYPQDKSTHYLDYRLLENGKLDILIPSNLLVLPASNYPVMIDPFLQNSNAVGVVGSTYNTSFTGGCAVLNPAPVPPHITITDVKWSFTYGALPPAIKDHGATDLYLGTCRSPSAANLIWRCTDGLPGPCVGTDISIISDFKSCIPAPTCVGYDLNVTMRFYRIIDNSGGPCSNSSVLFSVTPFTVTVEGWTLEPFSIEVDAPNATICEGDSTLLQATPQYGVRPFQYLWTPTGQTDSVIMVKPTVDTKYIILFTDSCGRTATDTVDVFVTPSDNPGFTFEPDSVCPGVPINFKANDPGLPSYYSWELPGSTHPTLSGIREFTTVYEQGGVYDVTMFYQSGRCKFPYTRQVTIHAEARVEVSDTICEGEVYNFYGNQYTSSGTYKHINRTVYDCDSILILHLVVNPIPPTPIITANTPVCVGDELKLEASEIANATYEWTGPFNFRSTDRKPIRSNVDFDMAGIYSVTSTKLNCTSPPAEVPVVVKPLPEIELRADQTNICSGDSVRLETIASPHYSYKWRPEHYMVTDGEAVAYAVVGYKSYLYLTVTDTGRCVSQDSIYINTEPCCEVFLPDAFTPNGDGKNDVFRIVTDGNLKLKVFRIVNRWGMTVFATADQNTVWDGTHDGQPQDIGTYHYFLEYNCPDGGTYEKKGVVTLIR